METRPRIYVIVSLLTSMTPSIVILTFNSQESIAATLGRALALSDDVVIVDSFSSDRTVEIGDSLGAKVVQRAFTDYGAQRNWAIDSLSLRHPWQLHLDADEWMDDALINAIRELPDNPGCPGFLIARYPKFLGRLIKHGGMFTWHLRLFRSESARCEARQYDQHFYLKHGTPSRLSGCMIDDNQMSLSEWTIRHNRWSDAEVQELTNRHAQKQIQPRLFGNPIEQKRHWRAKYERLPIFVRPFALFIYRYFLRLGVLDGKEGFIFFALQTFWFRFLIDAKLFDRERSMALVGTPGDEIQVGAVE